METDQSFSVNTHKQYIVFWSGCHVFHGGVGAAVHMQLRGHRTEPHHHVWLRETLFSLEKKRNSSIQDLRRVCLTGSNIPPAYAVHCNTPRSLMNVREEHHLESRSPEHCCEAAVHGGHPACPCQCVSAHHHQQSAVVIKIIIRRSCVRGPRTNFSRDPKRKSLS